MTRVVLNQLGNFSIVKNIPNSCKPRRLEASDTWKSLLKGNMLAPNFTTKITWSMSCTCVGSPLLGKITLIISLNFHAHSRADMLLQHTVD